MVWPVGYSIGDEAIDFSLPSTTGTNVSLSDYPDAKGFIVTFTCNHCPYAVAYESRIIDLDKKYAAEEMAKGDVLFVCSGVTDGDILNGVDKSNNRVRVNTLVMDSKSGTVTKVDREFY